MPLMLRCCVCLLVLLLGACASDPLAPVPDSTTGFELSGRMAVRSRDSAFSSALRWKQGGGTDEIWLNTPLGQTQAHLRQDRSGAVLTTTEQKQHRAASIESLTQTAFGWRFPLAGLRYWVLGQIAPGVPAQGLTRDERGRILSLRQADWDVALEYAEPEAVRPARLELAGAGAQVRLVIDRLELDQP